MRGRLIAIAGAIAVITPLAVSVSASAAGRPTAANHAGAAASPVTKTVNGQKMVTGRENFEVYSTNFEASFAPIYFTGVMTTAGTGYKDFSEGNDQAFLPIGNGTFLISHPELTQTTGVTTVFNAAKCEDTITGSGAVSFKDGTGAFTGISGKGTVHLDIRIFFRRSSSGCDQTDPPWGYIEIARGYLNASIPAAAISGANAGS